MPLSKNKIYNYFYKAPNVIEYVVLIFICSIAYFLFNQIDLTLTSTHGLFFLNSIFQGTALDFYNNVNLNYSHPVVYPLPIYILFAIWSIPVKFLCHFGVFAYWDLALCEVPYPLLMWYKLLPLLFLLGSIFVIWKIFWLIKFDKVKCKWVTCSMLCFPIVFFSLFIIGQYDSINMFFVLVSLYYYISKRYYKFSIWMAVAITFKVFPIIIFIPLVLLFEKRFIHILKYLIIGISLLIVFWFPFAHDPGYVVASQFNQGIIERFFVSGINTAFGICSFFILSFICLCVYSYMTNLENNDTFSNFYKIIYICLFAYSTLFVFIQWHPFWLILLVPFFLISFVLTPNKKISFVLSIIICLSFIIVSYLAYSHGNIDETMANRGLFSYITGSYLADNNYIDTLSLFKYDLWISLFNSCLIVYLIIKWPSKKNIAESKKSLKITFDFSRLYIWAYLLIDLCVIITLLSLYFRAI